MKPLRSFVAPLAGLLMAASAGAGAQGVLVDRSEIRFVSKQMGVTVEGRFRKWKASVDFRAKEPAKSTVEFEVDLASIELGNEERQVEARRPLWFDTSKYPVAKFASTAVRDLGGDRYEIAGTLTIKGTSRSVVVPVALARDTSGARVAEGEFAVQRLDYKVGTGLWADTDTVGNEVRVRVRMALQPGR